MKTWLVAVLALIVTASTSTVEAQRGRFGRVGVRGRWYRGSAVGLGLRLYPYGYGYGYPYGYGYGGTTLYGSYAHGMADVIRARGQAAENISRAQINYQEARSKYIDNQKKWFETYQERKRIGRANKQADDERRQASALRYQEYLRKQKHPRLTPSELDPTTGKLSWPLALQAPEFADGRRELDQLFKLRAQTGTTPELTKKIYDKAQDMRLQLLDKVSKLPAREYMESRRFLERMAHEAHHETT